MRSSSSYEDKGPKGKGHGGKSEPRLQNLSNQTLLAPHILLQNIKTLGKKGFICFKTVFNNWVIAEK